MDVGIPQRAPTRDEEGDAVGEGNLPGQIGRSLPGDDHRSLVDRHENRPNHRRGQDRAAEHAPISEGAAPAFSAGLHLEVAASVGLAEVATPRLDVLRYLRHLALG